MTRKEFDDQGTLPRPPGWGTRHTLAVLGFWAFAMNYAMRFNLSMAIVAMVQHSGHHVSSPDGKGSVVQPSCAELVKPINVSNPAPLPGERGEFTWSEAEQGFILGSFFWGYILTQIPGGMLSQKYGGKWVISIGLLITAILSFIIPPAARLGKEYLIAVRIGQGLAEGVTIPAMQVVIAKWFPPDERSTLATIIYSGVSVGTAITMVTSGYLIEFFGWPAVFYGIGGIGIVWFIVWTLVIFDTPAGHPRISEQEAAYIEEALGEQSSKVTVATPWGKILTSLPVWAIFAAQVSNAWGLYTLLHELPTYMNQILHFDIEENSWTSASPHICMWLTATLVTYLADKLIQRKTCSVGFMRKVCNSIAQWGTAIALIAVAYSGCNRLMAVIFLNLSVGLIGAAFGGFLVNSIDIAPNHAGVIMGIGNAIANICGFASPYTAGLLISGDPSVENWRLVFFLAAGIFIVFNTFYVIFASSTEMSWNRGPTERYESEFPTFPKARRYSAISESLQLQVG